MPQQAFNTVLSCMYWTVLCCNTVLRQNDRNRGEMEKERKETRTKETKRNDNQVGLGVSRYCHVRRGRYTEYKHIHYGRHGTTTSSTVTVLYQEQSKEQSLPYCGLVPSPHHTCSSAKLSRICTQFKAHSICHGPTLRYI